MKLSIQGVRRLVAGLGVAAALLAIAGCNDSSDAPPGGGEQPNIPTLERTSPDAP